MKIPRATKAAIKRAVAPVESDEEDLFVRTARELGWQTLKLNGLGHRDWPDQLVALPFGIKVLFEFKRVGEHLRDTQAAKRDKLLMLGHSVRIVYSAQDALAHCEKLITEKRNEKAGAPTSTVRDTVLVQGEGRCALLGVARRKI